MFRKIVATISRSSKTILVCCIKLYQVIISPLFGPRCRFYPSCSNYAIEAIQHRGALKGICFAIKRVLRCHPFSHGGHDPAPKPNKLNQG